MDEVMSADWEAGDRDSVLNRLGALVRAKQTGEVSERASIAARARLLAARKGPRAELSVKRIAGGTSAVAVATVAVLAARQMGAPVDAWSAENALTWRDGEGGYVSTARPDAVASLRFASGARVDLAAGSRGRVVEATQKSARLVLEAGHARVAREGVEAKAKRALYVEAGPCVLASEAGEFDVSWSGDALEVRVASGSVKVEGPLAHEARTLTRDQSLLARQADGEMRCF